MPATSTGSEFSVERAQAARALDAFCARYLQGVDDAIAEAIRYSILGEGKRLRAILVSASFDACGGVGDVSALAAAVEVVHAYSLVHDDLPCMDDDDLRRGRPTVHRAFGVTVATAAGMAMVPLAARAAWDAARALAERRRQWRDRPHAHASVGRRRHDRRPAARPRGGGAAPLV